MSKYKFLAKFSVILFCFIFLQTVFAQTEQITNQEIISLTKAGFDEVLIIQKIKTSTTDFDLSTDALIELKKNKVPDQVVVAMMNSKTGIYSESESMSPYDYGIYFYDEKNVAGKMTQLSPNVSVQNRTGGKITAAFTPFGLGKKKTKANLPGRNAELQIYAAKPVFYFYLDAKSGGLRTMSGIPYTPNEFTLVKFNLRSDNREITISKENIFGTKEGLSDEYVIEFDFENLGNGKFMVTQKNPLKDGEYAFFLANSGNSNVSSGIGAKFFDFGIKTSP